MKQLLKGSRVRGPKTPTVRISMKDLVGLGDLGIGGYKRKRGGTRLGSKASFKKMLRDV
jgi:hypothetical protein